MRLLDCLFQPVVKHVAVGQAGQGIEIGLLPDQFFGLLLFGNVREQRDITVCRAIIMVDSVNGDPLEIELTILAPVPYLALPMPGSVDFVPHGLIEGVVMAAGTEHAGIPADDLFQRVSRHLGKGRVDTDDGAIAIGNRHGLAAILVHHCGQL